MSRALFGLVCCWLGARGLHADDQTRIDNSQENPVEPSREFLYSLEKPSTLFLVENNYDLDQSAPFISSLKGAGHEVSTVVLQDQPHIRLKRDNNWLYDTIIIISNTLSKGENEFLSADSLIAFLDTKWLLPAQQETYGLKLPPSVMIFSDDGCGPSPSQNSNETISCKEQLHCRGNQSNAEMKKFLKAMGFKGSSQREYIVSQCPEDKDIHVTQVAGQVIEKEEAKQLKHNLTYVGGAHQYYPRNTMITPIVFPPLRIEEPPIIVDLLKSGNTTQLSERMLKGEEPTTALVSVFQAERSWSRMVLASSKTLCTGESLGEGNLSLCHRLTQWASHRQGVVTWSHLRHWRLHHVKEWSEFDGNVIRSNWTDEDLSILRLSRPYLYRIRDEILVAMDLWTVEPNLNKGGFKWAPLLTPLVKLEYNMMETYIRKLLLPATANITQRTGLMKAVQKRGFQQLQDFVFTPATHWIHFKAPKQHGIFKLIAKSVGNKEQSPIWMESLMPLRTYKHNEDPRFVAAGLPYYASLIINTIAFSLLCILFPLLPPVRDEKKGVPTST